jgi:hypothetical protein
MPYAINPFTLKFDNIGDEGSGTIWIDRASNTKLKFEGGQLNLYVNGNIEQSWQYTPVVTPTAGDAMGNLGGVYA